MGHRVVRVSVESFLDKFLRGENVDKAQLGSISAKLAADVERARKAEYAAWPESLCTVLNAVLTSDPDYAVKVMTTRARSGQDLEASPEPILALYNTTFGECALQSEVVSSADSTRLTGLEEHVKTIDGLAWNTCTMHLGRHEREDPFPTLEDSAPKNREHITQCIVETFQRQHREFAFLVVIFGRKARLTRWDNAGVVVTHPFDYVEDATPLLNFFYRLSKVGRVGQGFDTSVRLAKRSQIEDLKRYRGSTKNKYEQEFIDEILQEQASFPIYQLECDVLPSRPENSWGKGVEKKKLTLVIGKPHVRRDSPSGRGTNGYFAYAAGMDRLLFLKISWRPLSEATKSATEIERYRELHDKNVPHIPILVCGDDSKHDPAVVTDRELTIHTRTQELVDAALKPHKQVQTRLVFETLGISLSKYEISASLIKILYDAVTAHQYAWEDARILHGDISIGNILIDIHSENMIAPNGLLSDWDLSERRAVDGIEFGSNHVQSGTWAFMSGPSLRYPMKPPELSDDLEGIVHVVDFCALRFHHTSFSRRVGRNGYSEALAYHVANFFDYKVKVGSYWYGGENKFDVYQRTPFRSGWQLPKGIFSKLVNRLHLLCQIHYRSLDLDDLEKYSGREVEEFEEDEFEDAEATGAEDWGVTPDFALGSPHCLPQPTEATPQPTEAPKRPKDPFRNHDHILSAFWDALCAIKALQDEGEGPDDDKTEDQFRDLPTLGFIYNKSDTHSNSLESRNTGSSKRSMSSGSDGGPPNKRSRSGSSREDIPNKRSRSDSSSSSQSMDSAEGVDTDSAEEVDMTSADEVEDE